MTPGKVCKIVNICTRVLYHFCPNKCVDTKTRCTMINYFSVNGQKNLHGLEYYFLKRCNSCPLGLGYWLPKAQSWCHTVL